MIARVAFHKLFPPLIYLITNTPVDKVKLMDKIKKEKDSVYWRYEISGNLLIKKWNLSILQASSQNITKMPILND